MKGNLHSEISRAQMSNQHKSTTPGLKFSDTEALQFAPAEFKLVLLQLFSEAGARSPTGGVVPQCRGVRRRDGTKSFLSHLWSEEQ
ncbi:hypothetical protein EYF80_009515 [Liparis tanakae]|uniref:Uncharacterized protein n=1 Tax=Liparis tanakae TaxID=230148 RepID=A0A4Z2IQB9_9TELE|nr:hypothetical protein EYF80_009515 [Liparis tanakae]